MSQPFADVIARVELASRIAKSLLMFPLVPEPGTSLEEHAACLEIAYTQEIVKALNRNANS